MQVGYDSFANLIQILQKSLWISLQNWNEFGIKAMRDIIWQGWRVNLSKNVTCPDYLDFNMHLSRRIEIQLEFLAPVSTERALILAIWQLILCTPKCMCLRSRTANSKAAVTNSLHLKKKHESCCKSYQSSWSIESWNMPCFLLQVNKTVWVNNWVRYG